MAGTAALLAFSLYSLWAVSPDLPGNPGTSEKQTLRGGGGSEGVGQKFKVILLPGLSNMKILNMKIFPKAHFSGKGADLAF